MQKFENPFAFFGHGRSRVRSGRCFYFGDFQGVVRPQPAPEIVASCGDVTLAHLADGDDSQLHSQAFRNARARVRVDPYVAQQMGLFGAGPRVYADDETGSIAYYPALYSAAESADLFDFLERSLPWAHETMWMYDRTVAVPRLIARFASGDPMPQELAQVQDRVESFLDVAFTALSVQYYRNELDSVAWHSDHTEDLIELPVVALVSLGAAREMQVRSKARPRRSFSLDLEPGSLFVMSGRAQDFWEHHVPKLRRPTRPRISVALRQRRT